VTRQFRRIAISLAIRTLGWGLVFVCAALPAAAGQDDTPDARPPTTLEETLAAHVCGRSQPPSPGEGDAHEQCVHVQFRALRTDFGYNLSHLSTAERSRLDSTCSRFRAKPESLDPYLNCLTAGLVAIRGQRTQGNAIATGEPVFGVLSDLTPGAAAAEPQRRLSLLTVSLLIGVVLTATALAVAAVRLRKASSRVERLCQDCGATLPAAGDLCPDCRHRASVAMKQAAADRAEQERAEQERQRLDRERAEEKQRLREEQAARLQQAEQVRMPERPARPAPASPAPEPEDEAPDVFDPYVILGVSPAASHDEIAAAYQTATSKYDDAVVAHLGDAVRKHFRAKAAEVEEAYRTLGGAPAGDGASEAASGRG
jgi:DnaJ-domain-containing protein 1